MPFRTAVRLALISFCTASYPLDFVRSCHNPYWLKMCRGRCFLLVSPPNNPIKKKRNAMNLEQCWPPGLTFSFSKGVQALHLIHFPEIWQGSFGNSLLATLRNQPFYSLLRTKTGLPPSISDSSIPPILSVDPEWSCYVTRGYLGGVWLSESGGR